ncbi:MAG: hypothetical protein RR770_04385, partial [Bacteroidales bacterium]
MKRVVLILIAFCVVLFMCSAVVVKAAQVDTTAVVQHGTRADSLKSINAASTTLNLLMEERMLRLQDSLMERSLMLQINEAVSMEKRRVLEKELAKKQIADSLHIVAIREKIKESKDNAIGYPVVFAGDTIRVIYVPFGPLAAADRVENYTKKIKEISGIFISSIDSIVVRIDESNIEVLFKENVLCTITPADAMWVNKNQMQLAQQIAYATRSAIIKYKEMTSVSTIIKQIGLSILAIVGCYLIVFFINRAFKKKIRRFMLLKKDNWFKGWKLREYEILSSERQVRVVLFVVKVIRILLNIIVLYITLPILFSIYPFTLRLANTLFDWIMTPVKFILNSVLEYIPNLFVILIIW